MKVQIEIKEPITPNFVIANVGDKEVSIPIGELDAEEIQEYITLWENSVMRKWHEKLKTKTFK